MIGMMNSGVESSVEFYAAARQSSLYEPRKRSYQLRTYTAEGRVLVNGAPVSPTLDGEDLWRNMIIKAAAQKVISGSSEKRESGPMATIRRLSEKFKSKKAKSSAALMNVELGLDHKTPEVKEMEPNLIESSATQQFVTHITIEEQPESISRPHALLDDSRVLSRLLQESSLNKVDKERAEEDSGKWSSDDDSVVVVHKL